MVGCLNTESSPRWRIQLLGSFNVCYNDQYADESVWRCQSAQGIVAYLALNGPTHRERLMDEFWPQHSYSHARANLSSIMRYARHALREITRPRTIPALIHRRGIYSFDPLRAWTTDVCEFREAAMQAKDESSSATKVEMYNRALMRYQGELLPGFYFDWVHSPREELRQEYLDSLEEVAELYLALGNSRDSIETCRKILHKEPTCESAHRILIKSYAELGKMDKIVIQYRTLCDVLKKHLDVSPSEQTNEIYYKLTQGSSK